MRNRRGSTQRLVWSAAAMLILTALLVLPYRTAEGVESPGSMSPGNIHSAQSGDSLAVHGLSELTIDENSAIGTSLATYRVVTSGGADVSGDVYAFSLEGVDAPKYRIDSRSGELYTNSWIDFETDSSDLLTVVASSESVRTTLDVTVNVLDVEDSVSTLRVFRANPLPGVGQGNPEHSLDDGYPTTFVRVHWGNWGAVMRLIFTAESPDVDCGTGLDCITISLESDEAEDTKVVKARRFGETGQRYVAAVKLVDNQASSGDAVEITGADGEVRSVHLLSVEDVDEVRIEYEGLRVYVAVENGQPEFSDLEIEHNPEAERVEAELTFEVTDAHSGLPEPEDLPDFDRDGRYMPATLILHDSQCYSSEVEGESLEAVGFPIVGGSIYCDGEPEIYPIRDDRDFEEIENGYSVSTTLVSDAGPTLFVTVVACDKAGNCSIYDADEDSGALLLQVGTADDEPDDPCLVPINGDGVFPGEWDGTCPSDREPEQFGSEGPRYARYYPFTLEAESDVSITLSSSEDTYLYLLEGTGKDGTVLHSNDDIVPIQDVNSRIEQTLLPGNYTIEATTYFSSKTGAFTLEVSGIGAPPVVADCFTGIAVADPDENPGLVSDCEILLAAKEALAGTAVLNWSLDLPIEEWEGIELAPSFDRVNVISLDELGLDGTIPAKLGELEQLQLLSLSGNDLTGRIPSELGRLRYLLFLTLGGNRLSGELPEELGNLPFLFVLSLPDNRLTGPIPSELGDLSSLQELDLRSNSLSGRIPDRLADLEDLGVLYLAGNDFTGCIPEELGDIEISDVGDLGLPYCDDTVIEPPPPDRCVTDIGEFETGLEIIDDFWESECLSANRPSDGEYYAHFYNFELNEEADVTITLESGEDTYLYLLDGIGTQGRVLFEDDDTDGTNPRIRTTLQPGDYTVEATTYEIGIEGNFRVGVDADALNGRPPYTCVDPLPFITSGSHFGHRINLDDRCKSVSRSSNGEHNASYASLILKFPASVTITLTSEEDPYLFLLEGDGVTGQQLHHNDDADGLNSRIEADLQPGTYTIEATTFDENITGRFDLEVGVVSTSRGLCESGNAVSDPVGNERLVAECALLLDSAYILDAAPALNWSAGIPMEEWEGITLGGSPPRVIAVRLKDRGLSGRVPTELEGLSNLEDLDLALNRLTGNIPRLDNLSNLEFLGLSSNRLSGEIYPVVDSLGQLQVLYLHDNKLSGPIPPELGDLVNLGALGLDQNRLTGEIPPELGRLEILEKMGLSHNRLVGTIPPELADLPELHGLYLSGNRLTGCIPLGLRDVAENDFDALGLPFCPPKDVSDCTEPLPVTDSVLLRDAWDADCVSAHRPDDGTYYARYFTFNIYEATPIVAQVTSEEEPYLYLLEGEGVGGRIMMQSRGDQGVARLESTLQAGRYTIEVTTAQPQVTGGFELDVRMVRDASSRCANGVVVPLPEYNDRLADDCATLLHVGLWLGAAEPLNWATHNSIDEWEGVTVDGSVGRVTQLSLPDRGLTGTVPPEIGNLAALRLLDLQRNELSGSLPTEIGYLESLEELNVSINRLTGEVPAELGNLFNLWNLSLAINHFSGEIPPELGNLENLEVLWLAGCGNLTGSIPKELGNLTALKALDVAGNALTGEIPVELGNLSDLERLGLGNNFLNGVIPAELGDLNSLKDLYLYGNLLTGVIPKELASLPELKELRLEGNDLTNEIPQALGDIATLEILDLSFNELDSTIPPELGNLSELRELDLEENMLTGEIPASLAGLTKLEYSDFRGNDLTGCIPFGMSGTVETDPVLPECTGP